MAKKLGMLEVGGDIVTYEYDPSDPPDPVDVAAAHQAEKSTKPVKSPLPPGLRQGAGLHWGLGKTPDVYDETKVPPALRPYLNVSPTESAKQAPMVGAMMGAGALGPGAGLLARMLGTGAGAAAGTVAQDTVRGELGSNTAKDAAINGLMYGGLEGAGDALGSVVGKGANAVKANKAASEARKGIETQIFDTSEALLGKKATIKELKELLADKGLRSTRDALGTATKEHDDLALLQDRLKLDLSKSGKPNPLGTLLEPRNLGMLGLKGASGYGAYKAIQELLGLLK